MNWPKGIGGKGNEAIAGMVRQMPGAVGYVELDLRDAEQDSLRRSPQRCRHLGEGSIEGVTEAAASVKTMPADYRVSITNAPGKNCLSHLQLHMACLFR